MPFGKNSLRSCSAARDISKNGNQVNRTDDCVYYVTNVSTSYTKNCRFTSCSIELNRRNLVFRKPT